MWTRRCVIILKNEGGNTISKLTRHWTTSFCSFMSLFGLIAFYEISLRKTHSITIVNLTFSGRIPLSATRSNCVIRTWQSWDFKFVNFFSFIFILPCIFEEYPDGTFILFKQSNMLLTNSHTHTHRLQAPRCKHPSFDSKEHEEHHPHWT
jgi:hypothetical protein